MARFYARFDAGTESTLDSDLFDKRQVGTNGTAGLALRDKLIVSRSALSDDVYTNLTVVNQNGGKGVYHPPDSGPFSTNSSTFVSWSNVYTSSFNGIRTPTSNEYGSQGAAAINYSKRVTASVASTDTTIVGPADPVDASHATWQNYKGAADAVKAVLDDIQNSTGTKNSPYTREGNDKDRTFYSIWYDPSLNYFAWDDFTPGTMTTSGVDLQGNMAACNNPNNLGATSTFQFTWHAVNSYQFKNDGNGSGRIGISLYLSKAAGAQGTCFSSANYKLALGQAGTTHGGPLTLGTGTSGNGPTNPSTVSGCQGTSTWTWNGYGTYNNGSTPNLTWELKLPDCILPGYDLEARTVLYDAKITTSTGGTFSYNEQFSNNMPP